MAKHALESFLAQDYPFKELIILDDADNPSFEFNEMNSPLVTYGRSDCRKSVASKRNECCRRATGEIIVHFDSDDWSVPSRITEQVRWLELSSKAVLGYYTMLFFDGEQWGSFGGKPPHYAVGTSLCYRRSYWEQNPFIEGLNIGEDNEFARIALNNQQLLLVEGKAMMVARLHPDNTSPKQMSQFEPIDNAVNLIGFNA